MKKGSVLVDVAVDQGGCFETTRATTHADPTYVIDNVIHYCVANMPGAVPYTSTLALTNATLPYALQLAFSWTKLALYFNVLAIIILIPSMILLTRIYGALGACFVWLILNAAYVLGMIQLMHKRILPKEKLIWYKDDVGKPFISVLLIMVFSRIIVDPSMPKLGLAFLLIGTLLISMFVAVMSAPLIRAMVLARWSIWRSTRC